MKTIVVTGSQGFIGSYVSNELLKNNYKVIGIDNYSKYGPISRAHDIHPNFKLLIHSLNQSFPIITEEVDYVIAGASMIGGIAYFHKYAYDLLAMNERIVANTLDYCIKSKVDRILMLSSSMVFENTNEFPSKEESLIKIPPPKSSYGFQKLACEYFVKAAYDQYGLNYTIIRPFNCVGIGEDDAIQELPVTSGNIKLTLSHVIPDLIIKLLNGQNPLHIFGDGQQTRCYTNGADIAKGIRMALESSLAINEDFNISTATATSVLELIAILCRKMNIPYPQIIKDAPFTNDVQYRFPDVSKAEKLLNFKAVIPLEQSIDEVINYIKKNDL